MAMLRARQQVLATQPFQLVYSVRTPIDVYYADELRTLDRAHGVGVTVVHTRHVPPDSPRPPQRLTREELAAAVAALRATPRAYVCGPTGFVEWVADALVDLGLDPGEVRTERFGPS
jgi:ferredoxin-NADP reductase